MCHIKYKWSVRHASMGSSTITARSVITAQLIIRFSGLVTLGTCNASFLSLVFQETWDSIWRQFIRNSCYIFYRRSWLCLSGIKASRWVITTTGHNIMAYIRQSHQKTRGSVKSILSVLFCAAEHEVAGLILAMVARFRWRWHAKNACVPRIGCTLKDASVQN